MSRTQYSSTVDQMNSNTSAESSSSGGDTNKLKLFGFEFEFDPNPPAHGQTHPPTADESVNSSSSTAQIANRTTPPPPSRSRLRCEYCKKEFANSQAMGGHQNAHKKERMKKKRLQLQARRATVSSFYLHAPPNPTTAAARWFYEPATSSCDIDDEIGGGGRQISFTHRPDYFSGYDVSNNDEHRGGGFTLTHHRPVGGGGRRSGKAAAAAGSRGGTDYLDLELGLRLQ